MSQNRRILLIEDDHDIVRGARLRLRAAGYETLAAHNGREGLTMAAENHPDAILLDVRMPVMDGLSALSELRTRKETQDIPVVMLSASLMDEQASLDAGARFFIRKPYQGNKLVAAVDAALTQPRDIGNREAP